MKKLAILLLILLSFPMSVSAKSEPFLTASPDAVALGDTVTINWGNLPNGRDSRLTLVTDCFGGTEVLDLYSNSSWSLQTHTCTGAWTFQIMQGKKIVASDSVDVQ